MRTEQEVRALIQFYIDEYEGCNDPFNTPDLAPQDQYCLWCVRLRVLKWALGELDKPDVGNGMSKYGWAGKIQK